MKFDFDMPVMTHDAKRCYVYRYGSDGKITVSKRLNLGDDVDLVDAIESGSIQVENASEATNLINLSGIKVDAAALNAIAAILDSFEK